MWATITFWLQIHCGGHEPYDWAHVREQVLKRIEPYDPNLDMLDKAEISLVFDSNIRSTSATVTVKFWV
jgi:hypothetical protein